MYKPKPNGVLGDSLTSPPTFLEFFAGSGLVSHALQGLFTAVWANDICAKKAAVYVANHGAEGFHLGSVQEVRGAALPRTALSWASFPCQDLSLAGATAGLNGKRSGLVWQWLRVIDEMPHKPPLLVAENVVGLLSSRGGSQYALLQAALEQRGYQVGAVVLDAARFVPQSRPRVFIIAVAARTPLPLTASGPGWLHPPAMRRAVAGLPGFVFWNIPEPPADRRQLAELVDHGAAWDGPVRRQRNLDMLSPAHYQRFLASDALAVAPGYRRTRQGKVRLELRFDGLAGCLRTPRGGSSRQLLVIKDPRHPTEDAAATAGRPASVELQTRLLTVKEAAALMGAPPDYLIPGSYNDGYRAMGDAVAVPVARFLGERLLLPLWQHLLASEPAEKDCPAASVDGV